MAASDDLLADWWHVILGPDEVLLLQPRPPFTTEVVEQLNATMSEMPESLRGRVIAVDPDSINVTIVRKL